MPRLVQDARQTERFVLHVDMDSFYASAEVKRNPSLKGTPVIVGAPPDDGKGRGVVVACNYEARKYGVRSAMPISQAWRLCPEASYLSPDFAYYERTSEEVMRIIRAYGGKFQQVSIDEAFLDVSGKVRNSDQALNLVSRLRHQLKRETGLTCSVGVAENKSAAKIASDLNKPDRVTVVPRGRMREFLAPLPVNKIAGVGSKTEGLLHALGARTIGDIQRMDEAMMGRRLGGVAAWLSAVANGLENEEVKEGEAKSLSTERTFAEDTSDPKEVERAIAQMASELADRVQRYAMSFGRVGLKIRFKGFETHTREVTLKVRAEEEEVIRREATALLSGFMSSNKMVRLVGVRVSKLGTRRGTQSSIEGWMT